MLKKNVFLRTTKLKVPPSQIQTQDKSNAKFTNQKDGNHLHVEESLLSNHSSSTRTGSREKILSKHINTTFALSESQTSTTNKAKTSAGVKEDANCKESKIKSFLKKIIFFEKIQKAKILWICNREKILAAKMSKKQMKLRRIRVKMHFFIISKITRSHFKRTVRLVLM